MGIQMAKLASLKQMAVHFGATRENGNDFL